MNIIVAGDYAPINRIHDYLIHDRLGEIVSKELSDTIMSADFSIVNFECPIVCSYPVKPIEKAGPNLISSPIGIEPLLKFGFQALTMANNHFYDYGDDGVRDTINCCLSNGLKIVGGGNNIEEASRTLYIKIKERTVAIINACEHEFSIATEEHGGSNPLNPISQFYAIQEAHKIADYIIVIVHGGHEHFNLPSLRMQEFYRFFVDAGADTIINHHQHCYSGYEVYKGKPIFYGLGNFLFDKQKRVSEGHTPWNEGYMVKLTLEDGIKFSLIPYTQCDETPAVKLIKGADAERFFDNVSRLNAIIRNPDNLKSENDRWKSRMDNNLRSMLMPYSNRYLVAAANRGLLPKFLHKKKILRLLNNIRCESHRDVFTTFLSNLIK